MPATHAYVEHTAFRVRAIAPLVTYFRDVLGMTVTQVDGDPAAPRQVWLLGGVQMIEDPHFDGNEGRFGHLGIVCEDVPAAIEATLAHGGRSTEKGPHWMVLPDGLFLEFMPQKNEAVQKIRALDPRG
ncbi:VOC family protein [Paracoccus litorisediminis]|uniref:VOC family protein n=1 Tax=Paracoccus litorisediminis TaxID=2006130 RepID=A0A844HQB4_9RHOB|nr:VOC family protein [Paracoccus litorisediminis]MTH60345.1 VOC family protein [Paracoccus litorisediminis]